MPAYEMRISDWSSYVCSSDLFACRLSTPAAMRRLLYAALIFALLGPMPGTVMRFPEADLTQSVAARLIAFAPSASGMLRFVRGWHLVSPHSRFGGFSTLARTKTEAGDWESTRLTSSP